MKFLLTEYKTNEVNAFLKSINHYVYVYCSIEEDGSRKPIYIGVGTANRVFDHLKNLETKQDEKSKKIKSLLDLEKLDIDIIAQVAENRKTAFAIESACIDLIGLDDLENRVSGQSDKGDFRRIRLEHLFNIKNQNHAEILEEHKGFMIKVNKFYLPSMNELQTFEIVRGIWPKSEVTIAKKSQNPRYAFASHFGICLGVYEVFEWVPAGTQEYFTRELDSEKLKSRYEFVGKISKDLTRMYKGKLLPAPKSGNQHPMVEI